MNVPKKLAAKLLESAPDNKHARLMFWNDVSVMLKEVKALEAQLRKDVMDAFFPSPKEGTNNVELGNDWKVVCKQTVIRKCDEATFDAVFKQLPRDTKNKLIVFKPELRTAVYKKLPADQKKIFDEALIVKMGSASISVVPPKVGA